MTNDMVAKKTWNEFRETGLVFLINSILHVFGWAIVLELDSKGNVLNAYPSRVKFRGFSHNVMSASYQKITEYLQENIGDLMEEASDND